MPDVDTIVLSVEQYKTLLNLLSIATGREYNEVVSLAMSEYNAPNPADPREYTTRYCPKVQPVPLGDKVKTAVLYAVIGIIIGKLLL